MSLVHSPPVPCPCRIPSQLHSPDGQPAVGPSLSSRTAFCRPSAEVFPALQQHSHSRGRHCLEVSMLPFSLSISQTSPTTTSLWLRVYSYCAFKYLIPVIQKWQTPSLPFTSIKHSDLLLTGQCTFLFYTYQDANMLRQQYKMLRDFMLTSHQQSDGRHDRRLSLPAANWSYSAAIGENAIPL